MRYFAAEYRDNRKRDIPLIVIWAQPYEHGGFAKDALGWFTPLEAARLLKIPAEQIVAALERDGQLDTPAYAVEWT